MTTETEVDQPTPRVAFASYVDRNYLPGFEVLVKSLLVHNPWIDHDYIVFFDDLEPVDIQRISALYPRFVFRRIDPSPYDTYVKGDTTNYLITKAYFILDAFRVRDYDRLVTLDVDMVVLGDIRLLVDTEAPFAAVPQHFESDNGRRLNSGVMSFSRAFMSDEFEARVDAVGRSGDYDVERHDQGILREALGGVYERLDNRYNLVKRAVPRDSDVPADTRILHYTGRFKPWNGGELSYEAVEDHWHDWDLNPVLFWRRFLEVAPEDSPIAEAFATWAAPYAVLEQEDFDDLRAAGERYRVAGDFHASFTALRASLLTGVRPGAGVLREYGIAAMAVSQPDIARLALTQAAADAVIAPLALSALSELEWKYRDYDAAEAAAVEAIRYHPTLRKPHLLLKRIDWSRGEDGVIADGTGPRVGHVAFYVDHEGNFGDVMLPVAVRTSIEDAVPDARWSSIHAHQVFDVDRARWANENLDAIVIGGGGLFLPDTAPNANSGWQWNVTDEALRELDIPVIVYTVGYNLFPGQSFHGSRFAESATLLIEKAAFVGLRNHGSVSAVKTVVGPELAEKVEFLPCVTTVFGGLTGRGAVAEDRKPVVLLNIAFDRKASRFGDGYGQFVSAIADLATRLDDVAELRCLAHTKQDEQIVHDVRRAHGVTIPVDVVYGMPWQEAMDIIARADVVAGMRGHAGMIPFGIGVPILSIISHAKLRYFLEDIGHVEWGVDADDPELAATLDAKVREILADPAGTAGQLAEAQQRLRGVVDDANARIARIIRGA